MKLSFVWRKASAGSLTCWASQVIGIVVFFVGVLITQRVAFLRSYNIPEPVTGGFIAALAFWAVHAVFGLTIDFEMTTRDRLLVS